MNGIEVYRIAVHPRRPDVGGQEVPHKQAAPTRRSCSSPVRLALGPALVTASHLRSIVRVTRSATSARCTGGRCPIG